MKLHVYSLAPIDFWSGWTKAEHAVDEYFTQSDLDALWAKASDLALDAGWEGDVRSGPYVAGFPDPDTGGPAVMIAWKQENNGTTFVASPHPLPHLQSSAWKTVAR